MEFTAAEREARTELGRDVAMSLSFGDDEWQLSIVRLFDRLDDLGCRQDSPIQRAGTGSRYFDLRCPVAVAAKLLSEATLASRMDDDGEWLDDGHGDEARSVAHVTHVVVKVRLSDHGSAYCSEDLSFAFQPGGDDSDPETVINSL